MHARRGVRVCETGRLKRCPLLAVPAAAGRTNLKLITGRGNNSGPAGPKLLPAVRRFLDYFQYDYQLQPDNGAIIVFLGGPGPLGGQHDPGPPRSAAPVGPQPRTLSAYLPQGWG